MSIVITFTDGSKAPVSAANFRGCQFYTLAAAGKTPTSWIRLDRIREVEMGEDIMLWEVKAT